MAEVINNNTRPGTDATVTNYTPDFNGVNSYYSIPNWEAEGDFQIKVTSVLDIGTTFNKSLLGFGSGSGGILYINFGSNEGQILLKNSGIDVSSNIVRYPDDGLPHTITITVNKQSFITTFDIDGVSELRIGSASSTDPFVHIGQSNNGRYVNGQVYELFLTDLDDPTKSRYYPLCLPSTSGAMVGTTTLRDNLAGGEANQGTPNNFGNWVVKT